MLPWLAFGLNNFNHELCHGAVAGVPRALAAPLQLLGACVALNHLLFHHYHHRSCGNPHHDNSPLDLSKRCLDLSKRRLDLSKRCLGLSKRGLDLSKR